MEDLVAIGQKANAHLFTTYFKPSSLRWPGGPLGLLSPQNWPLHCGALKLQVSSLGELPVQSPVPPSLGGFLFYLYLRGLETNFFFPLFRMFCNFFIGN